LLAVGVVPGVEEGTERGVGLAHGLTRVILERFGDEFAVFVEILHALGGDGDFNVVYVILLGGFFYTAWLKRPRQFVRLAIGNLTFTLLQLIWRDRRIARARFINLHRLTVKVRVGK